MTALEVVGTSPITYNVGGDRRASYLEWTRVLHAAAADAQRRAQPTTSELFSLRMELRVYARYDRRSDLDNYVKPIQDALAECGVFGRVAADGSSLKGDERIDHLDVRRKRVYSETAAGVLAEVWTIE